MLPRLRAVLAHHVIFHANRAGLLGGDQATLARLTVDAVFDAVLPRPVSAGATFHIGKVWPMTTTVSDVTPESAGKLRRSNVNADQRP